MVRAIWYAYCGIATQLILVNGSGRNAIHGRPAYLDSPSFRSGDASELDSRPDFDLDEYVSDSDAETNRETIMFRPSHDDSSHKDVVHKRHDDALKKRGTLLGRIGWH